MSQEAPEGRQSALGDLVGVSSHGYTGAWTAYILDSATALVYDHGSGRLAQVTPGFVRWLTCARLQQGETVAHLLGWGIAS